MLDSKQLNSYIDANVHSYKSALVSRTITLNSKISALLGTTTRKKIRLLKSVLSAYTDKLFIEQLSTDDAKTNEAINNWRASNKWDKLEKDIYTAVLRDGVTYVLVSIDKNGVPVWNIRDSFDGKNGAFIVYDAHSQQAKFGVNVWKVDDDSFADVFYSNRIEKYRKIGYKDWEKRTDEPNEQWPIDWLDNNNNALGIALIQFGDGDSVIEDAIQIERDVNEGILDLVAVSRNMGFPQRYITGNDDSRYLTNPAGMPLINPLTNRPILLDIEPDIASIITLDKGSEIGQLPAADINTTVIDKYLELLSLVTNVPIFYFGKGDKPSGIALIQAESRLNSAVEDWQSVLTSGWLDLIKLSLTLSNVYNDTSFNTDIAIDLLWFPPFIESDEIRMAKDMNRANVVEKLRTSKVISVEAAVRYLHPEWDDSEVQSEVAKIQSENLVITA